MRTYGNCGNGNRHYGDAASVLKGRLMDEGQPYVFPSNDLEEDEMEAEDIAAESSDTTHEAIDSLMLRWGYDIADERYYGQ